MTLLQLGCCGAYCRTCPALGNKACRGCKLGYDTGERDRARARCKMKACCMGKGYVSCADCAEYATCDTLQSWYRHAGYKYAKYHEALEFIRAHGYDAFLERADGWRVQYGSLEDR
ncbi:MAG: DUF3795 domain-containing protein [Chloroflexi bacterium]|nr:DUF3795 domain-containing protein [Chloroflexota bacterium]